MTDAAGEPARPTRWQRLRDSMRRLSEEPVADDTRQDVAHLGGSRIHDVQDRQTVEVCGSVRSLTLPARGSVPKLVAELYDGDEPLRLVWLGRRAIAGIEPGTLLRARGRVCREQGAPTIFNPAYEIVPRGH